MSTSTSSTMTPSEREAALREIRELVADLYDAMDTGDPSSWVDRLTTEHDLRAFGTDPEEYWDGRDLVRAVVEAQAREMSSAGIRFTAGPIEVDGQGDVVWVVDQPTLRVGDGPAVPLRLTLVLTCEEDAWRIAHFHLSAGIPNEQLLGSHLTVG